jgi:flagellar biogenesis protein FliO
MIWATLKMMLVLGCVGMVLFFCVRMFKRAHAVKANSLSDGGIKILTHKLIAPQKYISLVEIAGEVFALGITAQQVTFLTKIENKDMLKVHLPSSSGRPGSFLGLNFLLPWQKKMKAESL